MMKKLSRLSIISLTTSSASLLLSSVAFAGHPDYKHEVYKGEAPVVVAAPCQIANCLKDGIYAGVGVGYDSYKIRQSLSVDDSAGEASSFNPPLSAKGWNGSLFVGYGQYFDRFYIGGEIGALTSGANASYSVTGDDADFTTKLRARASYNAAILPGLKVNNSTLVYARVGYVRTSFKSQETFSAPALGETASISKSTWGNGINLGIGVETAVCNNVSVRGEYNYIRYGSFNSDLGTKFSPSNNQFVLSGIYHFA